MGLLNKLIFDGVDSSDYGVYISGEGTYNAPKRRGEKVTIPGRNGDLILDEGAYENIPVEYKAFIGTKYKSEFDAKIEALRAELVSRGTYKRLTDTYHPDEFRLGAYREGLEVEPTMHNRAGGFTMIFDCKPQRFLVSGEDPIILTGSALITNPTLFASKPLLKVKGNGIVRIEPYEFIVSNNYGEIWIDSEIMESYALVHQLHNLTNEEYEEITDESNEAIEVSKEAIPMPMDALVSFTNYVYPQINPGNVPVWISSSIEELTIIPRWWRL